MRERELDERVVNAAVGIGYVKPGYSSLSLVLVCHANAGSKYCPKPCFRMWYTACIVCSAQIEHYGDYFSQF